MPQDKLQGALGLARRAGALVLGYDAVCGAAVAGQAALVMIACDSSEATKRRVWRTCSPHTGVYHMHLCQSDVAQICKKQAGVLAITNTDLAALCLRHLPPNSHKEELV